MVLKSEQFDDVYFSKEDGLAESNFVFIDGNDLQNRWKENLNESDRFVIGELGFGTGLNFLAAWKAFDRCAPEGCTLHFISLEKYPLTKKQIEDALQPWADDFADYMPAYLEKYPDDLTGVKTIKVKHRITLTIYFENVIQALSQFDGPVDAWFLDGFRPASNPDMWSEEVMAELARLSKSGTSFATFTAAGFVRRGLQAVGFDVRKVPGFGRKREMLVGEMPE